MQGSNSHAHRMWRLLFYAVVAAFAFLCIFSPLASIHAGLDIPASPIKLPLNPTTHLGFPWVIRNIQVSSRGDDILLITEVLYNPSLKEPDGEWLELFNPGFYPIDLSTYKIGDQATAGCCEGMLVFPQGAVLKPGQVIVVANKASAFEANYQFKPDYEMENSDLTVPVMIRYTTWAERSVELTNTGDELLVLGSKDQVVDSVSWGSSTYAFDPPVPNSPEGYSIERYPAFIDTDTALDWRSQESPQPGEVEWMLPTVTPSTTPSASLSPLPSQQLTPIATSTPMPTPFGGKLLLSEFLYNPLEKEPDGEWIEIYNAGNEVLSLQDFKLGTKK